MAVSRRIALAGIGAALVAALAGSSTLAASGSEETMHLSGTVSYGEQGPLPAGVLKIRLEDHGAAKPKPIAEVEVKSSGQDGSVPFEMNLPKGVLERAVRPGFTVRLERADGWLLALEPHGKFHKGDDKVALTINPVVY